jgi:hypothetical protein
MIPKPDVGLSGSITFQVVPIQHFRSVCIGQKRSQPWKSSAPLQVGDPFSRSVVLSGREMPEQSLATILNVREVPYLGAFILKRGSHYLVPKPIIEAVVCFVRPCAEFQRFREPIGLPSHDSSLRGLKRNRLNLVSASGEDTKRLLLIDFSTDRTNSDLA